MKNTVIPQEFPPLLYWEQVCKNCPKAATIYIHLWRIRDKKNKISIKNEEIRSTFLTSRQSFSHNMLLLAHEGLISVHETPTGLSIELVGWDHDENMLTL